MDRMDRLYYGWSSMLILWTFSFMVWETFQIQEVPEINWKFWFHVACLIFQAAAFSWVSFGLAKDIHQDIWIYRAKKRLKAQLKKLAEHDYIKAMRKEFGDVNH